ncbi:MAG: hypothetical protein GY857_16805 [Desulfobacula sp.]|nr:hypothetical protein [Desulfobacula sp.]
MKSSIIKYQYALNKQGIPINVAQLTDENRQEYICPGCYNVLIPILGKIRQKHFRHKTILKCSFETYLHQIGKLLFEKTYKTALAQKIPYTITYFVPRKCNACQHSLCEIPQTTKTWDLTKQFKFINVEKQDGQFIPDLLLKTQSQEKIYIEIAVTHKAEKNKIDSKTRIIEFCIEQESDFEILMQNHISVEDERISLFNFFPQPIVGDYHQKCNKLIYYFVVYKSGKCILTSKNRFQFHRFKKYSASLYIKIVEYNHPDIFIKEVQTAFLQGVSVKNCFLCRYHALNTCVHDTKPIFCKFYKKTKDSNFAFECEIFRPDPNAFDKNYKSRPLPGFLSRWKK